LDIIDRNREGIKRWGKSVFERGQIKNMVKKLKNWDMVKLGFLIISLDKLKEDQNRETCSGLRLLRSIGEISGLEYQEDKRVEKRVLGLRGGKEEERAEALSEKKWQPLRQFLAFSPKHS